MVDRGHNCPFFYVVNLVMNDIFEIRVTDGSEPVSLQTAKDWLRVTHSDEDDLITDLITVARKRIEQYCTRSLVSKTIVLTAYLDSYLQLPYSPINEITEVVLGTGTTDEWDAVDADDYYVVGYYEKHFKHPTTGVFKITYTTLANSDYGLLNDLKRVLLWKYENRGDDDSNMPVELMSNAKQLKIWSWV